MLVDDINEFTLRQIPKKIGKEMGYLIDEEQSLINTGTLCFGYEGGVDDISSGLDLLKERWVEYVNKRNPADSVIAKRNLQLHKCAELVDKLKFLLLNPLPLPEKLKSILLSESREDVTLFRSEKEKQEVIKESLDKIKLNALNRDMWIAQGASSLAMCMCGSSEYRVKDERAFLKSLIERYPPHPSFELCLMSIGSGELMQDWLLLQQLVQIGYSKIYLHLIDPRTSEENVSSLNSLISIYLKGSITIVHTEAYLEPNEIKVCRPFHAIHALDFDSILYFPGTQSAWESLITASECLKEHGLLFCSAFGKKYWFDAQNGQWNLPLHGAKIDLSELKQDDQEQTLSFAVTDERYFWQTTFYYLVKLRELKKNIAVKILASDKETDRLSEICAIAKRILAPNDEFALSLEYSKIEDTPYDMFLGTGRLIDEPFLEKYIPLIKAGGVIILNPHSCYRREDNYLKKGALFKQVHETMDRITEVAQQLSLSRSLQLRFC